MTKDEPLFKSAHDAMVFAFNFSGQQYDRSMMARVASPSTGSGNGLGGLDGAGQAGMIRQEVESLGRIAEMILIARFAPKINDCSCRSECCSGHKPNKEWVNAITWLSDHMRNTALAGTSAVYGVRRECVARYFTRKEDRIGIEQMALKHGIHRESASAYASRVAVWFAGMPQKKDNAAVLGMEALSINAIEDRLREIGMT